MTEPQALIVFEVEQTAHGLKLITGPGAGEIPNKHRSLGPVDAWPQHLFVPRLFSLWAVDNEGKTGAWVVNKSGILSFFLRDSWARYAVAHPAPDGHHWNLLDTPRQPLATDAPGVVSS